MSQHYPDPRDVWYPDHRDTDVAWGRRYKALHAALRRDGQIVPLLVVPTLDPAALELGCRFEIADDLVQAQRLGALLELAWPTILVEDRWDEDDL